MKTNVHFELMYRPNFFANMSRQPVEQENFSASKWLNQKIPKLCRTNFMSENVDVA